MSWIDSLGISVMSSAAVQRSFDIPLTDLQDVHIGEVPVALVSATSSTAYHAISVLLSKPRTRNHAQFLSQLSKELRAIRNSHDSLLYRAPRNICRPVVQLACVHLPCA